MRLDKWNLPHLRQQTSQSLTPALFPDAKLTCDVARVIHSIIQGPMAEEHEA